MIRYFPMNTGMEKVSIIHDFFRLLCQQSQLISQTAVHTFPNLTHQLHFPEYLTPGSLNPIGLLATQLRFCFFFLYRIILFPLFSLEHWNISTRAHGVTVKKIWKFNLMHRFFGYGNNRVCYKRQVRVYCCVECVHRYGQQFRFFRMV